jgi:hypothetical protein
MKKKFSATILVLSLLSANTALACLMGCRPGETETRNVIDHLIAKRFDPSFDVLSLETKRTADFDMIVGEIRGYEIFFKASVKFPKGANLDCAPDALHRAVDCSEDRYFSLIRDTRPIPGRQFIEPGGVRTFDEDLRFAELKGAWRGPDGEYYKP